MLTKDGRDTPIEKLTPDNYIVPRGEEKCYHAVIEVVQYDQKTGKKISRPRVQKFGKKLFEAHVQASLLKQGYTVTILHNPTEWLEAQKVLAAEEKAKAEQEKAKAEQERFDAAVAAAVEKALAAKAAEGKPQGGSTDAAPGTKKEPKKETEKESKEENS